MSFIQEALEKRNSKIDQDYMFEIFGETVQALLSEEEK